MDIKEFLTKGYTCYHVVNLCDNELKQEGFKNTKLDELSPLLKGDKLIYRLNNDLLIAVSIGEQRKFNIAASHTDSPCLKVKGNKLIKSAEGMLLNTEIYGGPITYSMLDVPLKIAGMIYVKEGDRIISKLYNSKFNINIPSLCVHHSDIGKDGIKFNPQSDLLPLLGGNEEDLYKVLSKDEDIIDSDLFVVPDIGVKELGVNNELLSSPRIDNLTSAYTSLNAIINSEPKCISVCCFYNNEEIGSETKSGALSLFLDSVLKNIILRLDGNLDKYTSYLANSMLLSIDNGHAVSQSHPEKSDVEQKVYMGKGIVIKHNVRYSTDGYSSSIVKCICDNNDIKYQEYYNRSDIRCGGTLGLYVSTNMHMNSVDIGLAQLGMHSMIETVNRADIDVMEDFIGAFYSSNICIDSYQTIIK